MYPKCVTQAGVLKMIRAPLPIEWESPKNILMRCAHANFFDQVADVLGKDVCELTGMLDLLCGSYTGVNELMRNIQRSFASNLVDYRPLFYRQVAGITEQRPFVVRSIEVPYQELELVRHRVCLLCHQDKFHSKIFADLRAFTHCPVHRNQFIQECPNCGTSYEWQGFQFKKCSRCKYTFKSKDRKKQSLGSELELYSMILEGKNDDVSAALYLLRHLRKYFEPEVVRSGIVLGIALDFLAGRNDQLLNKLQAVYEGGRDLPTRFLMSCFSVSSSLEVKERASAIVRADAPVCGASKYAGPKQNWFRLEQAEYSLNITNSTLRALHSSGFLNIKQLPKSVNIVLIDSLLNLMARVVETIPAIKSLKVNPLKGIHSQHLQKNLESVRASAMVVYEANWRLGLKGLRFAKLCAPSKFTSGNSHLLDISQFAARAKTYPDALRRACRSGFISSENILKNGHKSYTFKIDFVDAFVSEFCFISELNSKLKGRGRTILSAILKSRDIRPLSGPEIDGALVPIYRRSDVEHLNLNALLKNPIFESNAGRKHEGVELFDRSRWASTKQAKEMLSVNDQEIKALVDLEYLVESTPPGRKKDNFKYFSHQSVMFTANFFSGAVPVKDLIAELGISKREFYLRFVSSGILKVVTIAKRVLIGGEDVSFVRSDCAKFISLRNADSLTNSTSRHFLNLVNTDRIRPVSIEQTLSATHINLVERSMVNLLAVEMPEKRIF